jgi:DNA-binding beta-propeller fold protein YncE
MINFQRSILGFILLALSAVPALPAQDEVMSQTNVYSPLILVNVTDTSTWIYPSPDPVGIEYHPGLGRFVISDSEVEETPLFQGVNFYETTTGGDLVKVCDLTDYSNEPTGVAVNPTDGHIFVSDDGKRHILDVDLGEDGLFCTPDDVVTCFGTLTFNSYDPESLTFGQGKLYVADGENETIFILSPGQNQVFDGVPPEGDDLVNQFDVLGIGLTNPKGIAFHEERGTLFIVSRYEKFVAETSLDGELLNLYDISSSGILDPSGLSFGPNSRDASKTSLYITDRGLDNDTHPDENDGKIFEFVIPMNLYLPDIRK